MPDTPEQSARRQIDTLRAGPAAMPSVHPLPAQNLRACQVEGITNLDENASALLKCFRDYTKQHQAEITALQILYSRPFNQRGGLSKAHQLFGEELPKLLKVLSQALAA